MDNLMLRDFTKNIKINGPMHGGTRTLLEFDNGYQASIIRHSFSYGGSEGLFELATMVDGELVYDNPVADGDVRGYLTEEDVIELLNELKALPSVKGAKNV